jgi:hypothetical protein
VRRGAVRALSVASAAALLAGGCGGTDDEDEIRARVAEFTDAVAARDSGRICATMSRSLFQGVPCDETILIFARPPNEVAGEVVGVEVDGDEAVAELDQGSIRLERVDDEWKVAQLP